MSGVKPPAPKRVRPGVPRAYTLIEVMISIAVIAIALLGTMAALTYGIRGMTVSGKNTVALNHARQIIEMIRVKNLAWQPNAPPLNSSNLNDSSSARVALEAPPFSADFPAGSGFTRNISIQRVSLSSADYRYNIMQAIVTVYWWDHEAERKVVQISHLTRL